jgi:molybdopterin-containing oxidoreductase family iron-sulfur binding subunit
MTTASNAPQNGRGYWRSLQELAQSEEFKQQLAQEFPGGIEPTRSGVSRRRFLQIMAASTAMASLAGCRWPEDHIVPFAKRPDGYIPGESEQFATALEFGGIGTALLATSYDGRPVKVDGNGEHPWSLGAASAQMQATVLDLYDADRSRTVVRRDGNQEIKATWDDFTAFADGHFTSLADRRGTGLAFLAGATSSPSHARLRIELQQRFPDAH